MSGSDTFPGVQCTTGSSGWTSFILPVTGAFQRGNATVRMRIENYQPWVIPTELTRTVRLTEMEA